MACKTLLSHFQTWISALLGAGFHTWKMQQVILGSDPRQKSLERSGEGGGGAAAFSHGLIEELNGETETENLQFLPVFPDYIQLSSMQPRVFATINLSLLLLVSPATISTEINCTSSPNRAISPPSVHRRKSGLVDVNLLLRQPPPPPPPSEDWNRPNPFVSPAL